MGHVPCSRPKSTVAIQANVDLQNSPGFSRKGARMLIVTLKMMQQAFSLVLVGLIIRLCSARED